LWPWAHVDLDKPVLVFAAKDEQTMKSLVPQYWQEKGSMHPATVWAWSRDGYYLAVRTDALVEDRRNVNPYMTSYFAYISLILNRSVALPFWFERGLAAVMSNTVVRDARIVIGAPIPWRLDEMRNGTRMPVAQLIKMKKNSPEIRGDDRLGRYDSETWAFMHYLMFADQGAHAQQVQSFTNKVAAGADPDAMFREIFGAPEAFDGPLALYINRSIFSFKEAAIDASVTRESFPVRPLPVAESASFRALLHAAMNRPADARAAIAEARKGDPNAPESFVAEALVLDGEGKRDEAKAAYTRATEAESKNSYAYYRLASLLQTTTADRDVWTRQDALLNKAIELNVRDAYAYAYLGEIRSLLGSPTAIGLVRRAISLDPLESNHHFVAALVLHRTHQDEDAYKEAQAAVVLAKTDEADRRARQLSEQLKNARGGGGGAPR
jgi:hypothetical protein